MRAKGYILDWKPYYQYTGNRDWRAEVPGLGTYIMAGLPFISGTIVYFWKPGEEGTRKPEILVVPHGVVHSKEDAFAWFEENFIQPVYRMFLATKENPRRSRRNPDLLLSWNSVPEFHSAAVPGLGYFLIQTKVMSPVGWVRRRHPEIMFSPEGSSDTYQVTKGPSGLSDQELLRWVEDNLIPPLFHAMLSVGNQP